MSKKKNGLGTLITGMVLGAAAVFFSKKENRDKAKKKADEAVKKSKELKKQLEDNPQQVVEEVSSQVKKAAKKVGDKIKGNCCTEKKVDSKQKK